MKFNVGDLVRQNLERFFVKELLNKIPNSKIMQGMVLKVEDIPEDWVLMEGEEQLVEVQWANSYNNIRSRYLDTDLILISRIADDGQN